MLKFSLHIFDIWACSYRADLQMTKCSVFILHFKSWSILTECKMSNIMMNVHTSQTNCQRSTLLQEDKHSHSHMRGCERVPLSQVYSAWELHLTDGCFMRGMGSCHRGEILLQHWPLFEIALNVVLTFQDIVSRIKDPTRLSLCLHAHLRFKQKPTHDKDRGITHRQHSLCLCI